MSTRNSFAILAGFVLVAGSVLAQGWTEFSPEGQEPNNVIGQPPEGDDGLCDEVDDEGTDGLTCFMTKAVAALDVSTPTLTLEGDFCEQPQVFLGRENGDMEQLLVLNSGAGFIEADLNGNTAPGTCVVLVKCPCETCGMDVTIGAAGPDGPTGPRGDQGPAGPTGPQGMQGDAGPIGPTGAQGPQGKMGPAGQTGAQGQQGIPGPTGPAGAQGLQGNPGPTGPTGPEGPQGNAGPAGSTGPQGMQGNPGAQGSQGPSGPTGYCGLNTLYWKSCSTPSSNLCACNSSSHRILLGGVNCPSASPGPGAHSIPVASYPENEYTWGARCVFQATGSSATPLFIDILCFVP